MRVNNKGVTLIELVVSIGLMSLIMAVATTMIVNASRYFERQAAMVEIQNEAQIITNYLTETIMEATDMNFTITDASSGAGLYEFYEKDNADPANPVATGKGNQRILQYYYDPANADPNMRHMLYMISFDTGSVAPTIVPGSEDARKYLISDEVTLFNVTFDYGEETDPDTIVEPTTPTPGALPEPVIDDTKNYVVKNPLKVRIIFRIEHNGVGSTFEISADCRNQLDDITYTKGGTTTIFEALNR